LHPYLLFSCFIFHDFPGQFFLANCQMGRGRTTTAMVIAALVTLQRPNSSCTFDDLERFLQQQRAAQGSSSQPKMGGFLSTLEQAVAASQKDVGSGYTPQQELMYKRGIDFETRNSS
jgi:hypothetical protein